MNVTIGLKMGPFQSTWVSLEPNDGVLITDRRDRHGAEDHKKMEAEWNKPRTPVALNWERQESSSDSIESAALPALI